MNQPTVITPFTLSGAMAPVTLIGALAQQNAEALAGIAVSQFARPGAPVVYGAFTTNVNMKTGAPAFGTPEYAKAAIISGQLARRYRMPFRSSNINTSNAPDAQAAYESMMATWSAVMGGVNFLHQSAGWLEGGLTASFEKFVMDIEMLQLFASFLQPEKWTTRRWRSMRSRTWGRVATSLRRNTRWIAMKRRSTRPCSRIGAISTRGKRTVRRTRPNAPRSSLNGLSRNMKCLRWTLRRRTRSRRSSAFAHGKEVRQ